ncbi:hypothetical protein ACJ73_05545 [Blastomyces percursus]|uniref:Uncharacterized protein n=1 Tax=Blastomyces percursus TaxID=1658174 RepID=A0A1J9Q384_9EURO|nr:hypothetical protein ACJ73_05545 [Blastomyces percursus]
MNEEERGGKVDRSQREHHEAPPRPTRTSSIVLLRELIIRGKRNYLLAPCGVWLYDSGHHFLKITFPVPYMPKPDAQDVGRNGMLVVYLAVPDTAFDPYRALDYWE